HLRERLRLIDEPALLIEPSRADLFAFGAKRVAPLVDPFPLGVPRVLERLQLLACGFEILELDDLRGALEERLARLDERVHLLVLLLRECAQPHRDGIEPRVLLGLEILPPIAR